MKLRLDLPFRLLAALAFLVLGAAMPSMAEPLQPGADAPRIDVTLDNGEIANLGTFYDRGPVLVYFYPKSDTPGCTKQACNIRDNFQALSDKGVTVLGVSVDTVEAQKKFREKYNLPFNLVADKDKALGKAFGMSSERPVHSRQSFLIVGGKVVWFDAKATPATQAEDALAALARATGRDS